MRNMERVCNHITGDPSYSILSEPDEIIVAANAQYYDLLASNQYVDKNSFLDERSLELTNMGRTWIDFDGASTGNQKKHLAHVNLPPPLSSLPWVW